MQTSQEPGNAGMFAHKHLLKPPVLKNLKILKKSENRCIKRLVSPLYIYEGVFSPHNLCSEDDNMAPEVFPVTDLVGESGRVKEVIRSIGIVAPIAGLNLLVTGESGTGKELTVKAIHLNSPLSAGPFVTVNCAAIPRDLVESELFGHEKGSFTGAISQKKGKFELAHDGTLFLDEVGEIPLDIQPKLLRAIGTGDIQRVGRQTDINVRVRVIAATNKDLREAVRNGTFRADLYFRFCNLAIRLPALRERREDIPVLTRHFIAAMGRTCSQGISGKPMVKGISREAESILCNYDWPGNIRQLENVIRGAIIFTAEDTIQPADLQLDSFDPQTIAAPEKVTGRVPEDLGTMDEA